MEFFTPKLRAILDSSTDWHTKSFGVPNTLVVVEFRRHLGFPFFPIEHCKIKGEDAPCGRLVNKVGGPNNFLANLIMSGL